MVLTRAVYLLQHPAVSTDDTLSNLLTCLHNCEQISSTSRQLRVVRCLLLMTDTQTLRHLCTSDWVQYLASLLYTNQLQVLCILPATASHAAFQDMDKSSLVRALCRCCGESARRLAVFLASDFGLCDLQIWSAMIRHLSSSDVELLLRRLPCVRAQITMLLTYLVKSWLDKDTLDESGAVRICLLLHHFCSTVNTNSSDWQISELCLTSL